MADIRAEQSVLLVLAQGFDESVIFPPIVRSLFKDNPAFKLLVMSSSSSDLDGVFSPYIECIDLNTV